MADVVDIEHHSGARSRPRSELDPAALATSQHGVLSRAQLLQLGVGRGAIRYRLAVGRLHRVHVGVYAVGHSAMTKEGRWMAAALACGPAAVLSHRSAAALWGLRPSAATRIDVTVPGRSRRGRPGIALHLVRELPSDDRSHHCGIPITTVARTLLDLADVVRPEQLERAFEEADRLRLLDVRALERVFRRSRGRRGLRPLADLLAFQRPPAPPTRSELERRFLDLCRTAGLPRPAVNVMVAGFEVDALWLDARLIVELDGYAFHRTVAAFERDRRRDAMLQLAGYRVMRFTHRRLEAERATVVETVRGMLSAV